MTMAMNFANMLRPRLRTGSRKSGNALSTIVTVSPGPRDARLEDPAHQIVCLEYIVR